MTLPSIIHALQNGRCFASEAPMLDFHCGDVPMGGLLVIPGPAPLTLQCRVADYAGLRQIQLRDGHGILATWNPAGVPLWETEFTVPAERSLGYFRLEAIADDGCRAFSAPIYVLRRR